MAKTSSSTSPWKVKGIKFFFAIICFFRNFVLRLRHFPILFVLDLLRNLRFCRGRTGKVTSSFSSGCVDVPFFSFTSTGWLGASFIFVFSDLVSRTFLLMQSVNGTEAIFSDIEPSELPLVSLLLSVALCKASLRVFRCLDFLYTRRLTTLTSSSSSVLSSESDKISFLSAKVSSC